MTLDLLERIAEAMGALPIQSEWKREAERLLVANGKDVDTFPKKLFLEAFFRTIGHIYWERLVDVTIKEGHGSTKIAKQLSLSKSTISRWMSHKHPPSANKFFAFVVLLLQRELKQLDLGKPKEILFDSVRRQFEYFAADYCNEGRDPIKTRCEITHHVFKSILHAMRVPEANGLAPNAENMTKESRRKALEKVVKHVNVEAKRAFDHQASRSMNFIGQFRPVRPSELNTWLTDWGIPYTLFATGCPSVWEIDDA